jgi:hypothetical protein
MSLGTGVALLLWRLANRVRSRRTVETESQSDEALYLQTRTDRPRGLRSVHFIRYRSFFPGVKWPESDVGHCVQ